MRDDKWLMEKLHQLWSSHFPDIHKKNKVHIQFGRKARRRFGSIRCTVPNPHQTLITINGHFRDHQIPESILEATIAHELCHYSHGFASPHQKKHKHPHRGGIVEKELHKRGLGQLLLDQIHWIEEHWHKYLDPRSN